MTINELYRKSLKELKNPDIDEINIRILICYIKGYKTMSEFYTHKNENIEELQTFRSYFTRFLNGEPVQYITNSTEFFGEEIYVDRRVLIPRQETEEVVDFAIKKSKEIFGDSEINVADVCCGSGCIGIALSRQIKIKYLYFSDISFDALDVARFNCKQKGINADFYQGDALIGLIARNKKVNLIVANPPYILNQNDVDESVKRYEPSIALYADDGLSVYKSIIQQIRKVIKGKILVVFEIGYDLKDKLEELIKKEFKKCEYEFIKDINGKYRIMSIYLN